MENIVKRRDTLFAKMQWEHEVAKSIRQRDPHPSEITERLDRLRETRSAFEDVQTEIELAAESLEPMATIFNHRMEFDNIYYAVKTIYVTFLDSIQGRGENDKVASLPDDFRQAIKSLVETQERFLKAQAAVSTSIGELAAQQRRPQADGSLEGETHPNANLRLPVFAIPVFRGDRKEWRTFKDLFETGIHNRDNISNVLKLQYLLSYLDGEAKILVSAFPISDANYEPAWVKLNEHYDKKKYIVYSLVREFCDQPAVTNPVTGLHKLVTTSDDIVRQLSALGDEYEARDPWLIHLILEKLDEESRSLWARNVVGNDNPSFEEFLEFLQDRCDALETFSAFTKMSCGTDDEKETTAATEEVFQNFHANTLLCQTGQKQQTSTGSTSTVAYTVKPAQATGSSSTVKLAQTTGSTSKLKPAQTTQVSESSTSKVVACSGGLMEISKRFSASSITVLPTVLVKIRDKHGLLHEARVLIDSGSQVCLITQEFAAQLAIPRRNAGLVVTGLSQLATRTTKGVVHLVISSRFSDSVVLSTDAYILGRLTAPLPRLELDEAQLKFLDKLKLADPLYYEGGPIDVILGADVFLPVIRDGQIRDESNWPVAQNSAFGWIISGKYNNGDSTIGELDDWGPFAKYVTL